MAYAIFTIHALGSMNLEALRFSESSSLSPRG